MYFFALYSTSCREFDKGTRVFFFYNSLLKLKTSTYGNVSLSLVCVRFDTMRCFSVTKILKILSLYLLQWDLLCIFFQCPFRNLPNRFFLLELKCFKLDLLLFIQVLVDLLHENTKLVFTTTNFVPMKMCNKIQLSLQGSPLEQSLFK